MLCQQDAILYETGIHGVFVDPFPIIINTDPRENYRADGHAGYHGLRGRKTFVVLSKPLFYQRRNESIIKILHDLKRLYCRHLMLALGVLTTRGPQARKNGCSIVHQHTLIAIQSDREQFAIVSDTVCCLKLTCRPSSAK